VTQPSRRGVRRRRRHRPSTYAQTKVAPKLRAKPAACRTTFCGWCSVTPTTMQGCGCGAVMPGSFSIRLSYVARAGAGSWSAVQTACNRRRPGRQGSCSVGTQLSWVHGVACWPSISRLEESSAVCGGSRARLSGGYHHRTATVNRGRCLLGELCARNAAFMLRHRLSSGGSSRSLALTPAMRARLPGAQSRPSCSHGGSDLAQA